jgi:hypothetical protein
MEAYVHIPQSLSVALLLSLNKQLLLKLSKDL